MKEEREEEMYAGKEEEGRGRKYSLTLPFLPLFSLESSSWGHILSHALDGSDPEEAPFVSCCD